MPEGCGDALDVGCGDGIDSSPEMIARALDGGGNGGGTLVVVGLAREGSPAEWAATVASAPVVRAVKVLGRAHGPGACPSPTRG
ncbi:hypothetical protein ACWGJ2_30380 [Streptomyces sp. NPDC054796]